MAEQKPPLLRKADETPWYAWVVAVVVPGAAIVYVVRWVARDPWQVVAWGAGVVALGGIGVLSVRFQRVGDMIDSAFTRFWRAMAWCAAALGPAVLARALSNVVADAPRIFSWMMLAVSYALFGLAVLSLSDESRRERVWNSLRRFGRGAPLVYAFVLAELAIVLFATTAFVMADRELIRFDTTRARGGAITEPADTLDFFTWQMLDAIPALKIPQTLRWNEPLSYNDGRVGLLVIAFKVIAITPIVLSFRFFWKSRHEAPLDGP